ncbi:hypothetical protein NIES2100_49780 [Calothrix sp. NIES-2100]|uniref:hypothetical protein n=1 Tax=Calothrix sp. NIES-2100 TaxID=1954172 RepID=UPI000B61FF96|nr:hypothetical protein NIES2100_49780 [Calothrix sp. NIES-2100]
MILPIISAVGIVCTGKLAAMELGKSFAAGIKKDFMAVINDLFDKLNIFAQTIDFIALEWIGKIEQSAKVVVQQAINDISQLIDDIFDKTRGLVEITFKVLFQPIFDRLELLERNFIKEINLMIDKIERIVDTVINDLQGMLGKIEYDFRKLSISSLLRGRHELDDIYKQRERNLLRRLNGKSPLNEILRTYGQLEYNALEMARIRRGTVSNKLYTEDYLKYGMLFRLWYQFWQAS